MEVRNTDLSRVLHATIVVPITVVGRQYCSGSFYDNRRNVVIFFIMLCKLGFNSIGDNFALLSSLPSSLPWILQTTHVLLICSFSPPQTCEKKHIFIDVKSIMMFVWHAIILSRICEGLLSLTILIGEKNNFKKLSIDS